MTSQNEIDDLYDNASAELDTLLAKWTRNIASANTQATVARRMRDDELMSFVKDTCHAKWLRQCASTHPMSTILLFNKIHAELHKNKLWDGINKEIQTSQAYEILKAKHPRECNKFLNIQPISEEELKDLTLKALSDARKKRTQINKLSMDAQFTMAASDFQTVKQVWDVRDEVRRRLVSEALINHDFRTRAAALSIGCKSDGALVGNVRALFGTANYKRETIEPAIRNWKPQTTHPFQPVIEELVALGKLQEVEEQLNKFYPSIVMRAAKKAQFVKIRIANLLEIDERGANIFIASSGLQDWFEESQREFLKNTCEVVGYNVAQVAALLNVDVRYVTQQITHHEIQKPNDKTLHQAAWPFELK